MGFDKHSYRYHADLRNLLRGVNVDPEVINQALDIIEEAEIASHEKGESTGYDKGYDAGYRDGENDGYDDGHRDGRDYGYEEGYRDGREEGRLEGYDEAVAEFEDS